MNKEISELRKVVVTPKSTITDLVNYLERARNKRDSGWK